jgi:carbon-monoxide dehydrogenase large subunit
MVKHDDSWRRQALAQSRLFTCAGEAGATGAPPAVIGAILDALRPLGIDHIDMPATPHRIWQAIHAANATKAAAE